MKKWGSDPIFSFLAGLFFLEKFELLDGFRVFHQVMPPEYLHHSKLFIRNAHDPHMALWREDLFYPLYMDFSILPAGAMTQVNAELEHIEPIAHNLLSEPGIYFPVLLGFGWQVKKYEHPHDTVCIKTVKHCFGLLSAIFI